MCNDVFYSCFSYLTLFIEVATGSKDAFGNISGLRTFRVLRALRTVSIVPGKCCLTPTTRGSTDVDEMIMFQATGNVYS